jgi:RNA polymerase subunit RPABC4/transcription elongation factor Spt4
MRLVNARLCLDCEEVHGDQHCPICGSESFAFLTRWVTPSDTVAADTSTSRTTRPSDAVERREQVDAYKQILNPPPPRRGRMVARAGLGLALLGLARMWFRSSSDTRQQARSDGEREMRSRVDQRS